MNAFSRLFRRVPFVPQMEVAECGAACLTMVLRQFGSGVPLSDVRFQCGVARDGVNGLSIKRAAQHYGLAARALSLDLESLHELPTPAILHWDFSHFVVLERMERTGATIVDPASGRRRVSARMLERSFTGVALTFEPTERLVRGTTRSTTLARYLRVLRERRGALALLFGCLLLLELVGVVLPAGNQVLIDHVIRPARNAWLPALMATLGLATLAHAALSGLRQATLLRLTAALDLTLKVELLEHMLRLPLRFFTQRNPGDLMQRVSATEALRDLTQRLLTALLDGLLVVSYGGLMFAYHRTLGGLAIGFALVRTLAVTLLARRVQQRAIAEQALAGKELGSVIEALAAPEVVRAFGAEAAIERRHADGLVERANTTLQIAGLSQGLSQLAELFDACAGALILYLGGHAVMDGQLTMGTFAGFLTLHALLVGPLSALASSVSQALHARGVLSHIDDVLGAAPEACGTQKPGVLQGKIELDDVSYQYDPASLATLAHIRCRVLPGEKVAIVGRSGAGKSTIGRLMLGLLPPASGEVRLDDVPLAHWDLSLLRRQIGVVPQEPFFFADTVRNNLSVGAPEASLAELREAARLACIDDVIMRLPQGYDTRLGTHGAGLSGGQRQRLALARALLMRPRILLLDEATSALDAATERKVHENLRALACTRVVIAHRLATVADADRVLVVQGGKLVQEGSFGELSQCEGEFRELLRSAS